MQQQILQKVAKLVDFWEDGSLPHLAEHEVFPELPKNSRINYLYFTLPVYLNFQRNSPQLWQAALQTFLDPATHYLFLPEMVVTTEFSKLQQDLLKHKLALQPNKHPKIWLDIATTLYQKYESDPRKLFKSCHFDAKIILELITKPKNKGFPYLKGPKLSNYWLFILSKFTDAKFANSKAISIIPDTNIIQKLFR